MNTSKIIRAVVGGGRYTTTAPLMKEDHGIYLKIEGIDLPATYEVDFSNSRKDGASVTMIGNADGVLIPTQFIKTGKDVFAFLYHVGADYGKTVYTFCIPNHVRPDRTDDTPEPEQQSVIDQTIAALNTAVAQTAQDVLDADASAQSAAESADRAETAATTATNKASEATTAAQTATTKAGEASTSASTATSAKDTAVSASQTATAKATEATTAATSANTAKTDAVAAKTAAETAQGKAEDAQAAAEAVAESIPSDYSQLSADVSDIKENLNNKAPVILKTASGSIASFSDGADGMPMKSLLVNIDPVQSGSGDPSPDNVRPISGWTGCEVQRTGKNLFDKNNVLDGYIDDADGGLKGTVPYKSTHYIRVNGGSSYYVKSEQTASMWGAWYDENKNFVSGVTMYANSVITAPSNATYVRLTIASTVGGNVDTFAVNYPSTATDYEPYQGNTYSVDWTTEAGTVYGGHIDVVSGELVVDRAMVTLDGTHYTLGGRNAFTNVARYYVNQNIQLRARGSNSLVMADRVTPSYDATIGISNNTPTGYYIWVYSFDTVFITLPVDVASSNAEATAWLAEHPIQLVYELATPITYQLTPTEVKTMLGTNHVWADTGDVEVQYRADTKLFIHENTVEDVQVNGQSIVSDGVANVPLANANDVGLMRVGYGLIYDSTDNRTNVSFASANAIKDGLNGVTALNPARQHQSVFYGLAKASGDTTQSASSNAVGNYTDTAKGKIQIMLGVAELIGNSEGATASKAYSVGDVFQYNGKLYKATAPIAQGSAIVPNTNCTQTTIIDLLRGV